MPPPIMTTRAWVGKFAITPSSRPEPSVARRSGGTCSYGSSQRGGPSAPLRSARDDGGGGGASQPPRQRRVVHLAHLGHARLHRVTAGRGIDRGHLRELVEMTFLHPELGQGMRDADLASQVEAPFHEAVEGRVA